MSYGNRGYAQSLEVKLNRMAVHSVASSLLKSYGQYADDGFLGPNKMRNAGLMRLR